MFPNAEKTQLHTDTAVIQIFHYYLTILLLPFS